MNILRSIIFAVACIIGTAAAQFNLGFGVMSEKHVRTSVSAGVTSYRPGEPFYLYLKADITEPWHAYYRNPAAAGMPMQAELTVPQGFRAEGPYVSVPERTVDEIGVAYTYSKPVFVWKVTPEAATEGAAEFSVTCTAQVCKEGSCNPPETHTASMVLNSGDGAPSAAPGMEKQAETLGDTELSFSAVPTAGGIQLSFSYPEELKQVYFFSDDNSINPVAEQVLTREGNTYTLTLPRNDNSDAMYPVADESTLGQPLQRLKGLLAFDGKHCRVDIEPQRTTAATAGIPDGFAGILLSLFLGGLILNLMPCVFPVIGLKVMSFVEMGGGSRSRIMLHSACFVLGILVSFWLLGMMLIVLSNLPQLAALPAGDWLSALWQDAGAGTREWAVWMQNPWVIYAITLLLVVLGLNMYGVFEIGVTATGAGQKLQSRQGIVGAFFQGLFITVVATPCSAPFLGAALPAAMTLPGAWMLCALTAMALGLAFPYIVLGIFPALVSKLPRPGAWMESLRQGLSFCLFLAAAWLLSVYLSTEPERTMGILINLVLFIAAFWVYGRWCSLYRSTASKVCGWIIGLALACIGIWGAAPSMQSDGAGGRPEWEEWSPDAMQEALDEGTPVFVDFTAKWCATCQYNKATAYSDEVYTELQRAGVRLMKADKTRPNEAVETEMRRLKRTSVPVNVLYRPDTDPLITAEVLTPAYLLNFLQENLKDFPVEEEEE